MTTSQSVKSERDKDKESEERGEDKTVVYGRGGGTGGAPPSRQQSLPPPTISARSPRPRRSGSTTPAVRLNPGATNAASSSSRSSSPSRLRSLPSVGISNVEALSDAIARIADAQQQRQRDPNSIDFIAAASSASASSSNPTSPLLADGQFDHQLQLLALAAGEGGSDEQHHQQQEDYAREKEAVLPPPRSSITCKFAEEPLIESGISDYTFIPLDEGGLLGRGKFSSVQLAWKNGTKYAVKVTPLYPHHNLIATRLLREPTILAQLPLHPNLVKVYESIRTPGHFYLVEEYLDGYTNLENFVAAQPNGKLNLSQATQVYHQLVSVVRSALHKPIQIAHRDIKPENILIHPSTLRIILLDFGLATHFSAREPRLTTCCGSPAFHAPELVLSLRSPPGSVRYWGPEIDIWTIGVTLLRCVTGVKYPLGVQHTSLQHLADKTIDAVLSVRDKEFKGILAGLLDMDGNKRMDFFARLPSSIDDVPYKTLHTNTNGAHDCVVAGGEKGHHSTEDRTFKNTSFIETEVKHSLSLVLYTPSPPSSTMQELMSTTSEYGRTTSSFLRSRSQSRDRLSSLGVPGLELSVVDERLTSGHPIANGRRTSSLNLVASAVAASTPTSSQSQIVLLNPNCEPAMRAISYVKYALRCAGILYHCQSPSEDLGTDKPAVQPPNADLEYPILHCVRIVPKSKAKNSPAASLLSQLRPPLLRASTTGPRSSSTPPSRAKTGKATDEGKDIRCLEFWLQIIPVYAADQTSPKASAPHFLKTGDRSNSQHRKRPKSKHRGTSLANVNEASHKRCTKLRLRVSDESVVDVLRKALQGGGGEALENYALYATPPPPRHARLNGTKSHSDEEAEKAQQKAQISELDEERGRPKLSRSKSSDSRSPPRPKPQRAHTHAANGDSISIAPPAAAHANGGEHREVTPPTPLKDDQIVNGIHEVRLDKDEVRKIQSSKRGFFDFVTFSKRNTSPKPTAVATAPTSPASITEDDDSPPLTRNSRNEQHNVTFAAM